MFDDVGRFHMKFELPIASCFIAQVAFVQPNGPTYLGPVRLNEHMRADEAKYRVDFMEEELTEFKEGVMNGDLEQQADALADIIWVALGTAHHLGSTSIAYGRR
jgi:hypothetical protein